MTAPGETERYEPTPEEQEELRWLVAEQVLRSGKKYEQIFGVARGGMPLAFVLSKALGIHDVQLIRSFCYTPKFEGSIEEEPVGEPVIMLPLPFVKYQGGDRSLIAEDMIDTGGTLEKITQMQEFQRADVAVEVSKETPEYTRKIATYCAKIMDRDEQGNKVWIDFPYDRRNRELHEKLAAEGAKEL